ncbi:MAG: DEAD/DEAH box helicase [Planctomycetota bacterium]
MYFASEHPTDPSEPEPTAPDERAEPTDPTEADETGADDTGADETGEPAPDAPHPFAAVPDTLHAALTRRGFTKLTEVQHSVLAVDDGARDLRISSQTGSGKTVALGFALARDIHDDERNGPTTLIVAPTRELAMQVCSELAWLYEDLRGVRCEVVTGGTNLTRERTRLKKRPEVLVGTPGRLLDHIRNGALDLSSVHQLVLDEADQMLDLGFKDELDAILAALPEARRTHLVSATFPSAVVELADRFQRDALLVAGQAPGAAHADIEHVALRIRAREHYPALVNLLLLVGDERTLVFVRTREDTTSLADKLSTDGFTALPLNGDLAQAQRTRTLNAFKTGTIRTLIATDVAARGLDVPEVTTVVNVDPPIDAETYVHRSGRTGRAGKKGRSVMLVLKSHESRVRRLYAQARVRPEWTAPPTPAAIAARELQRAEQQATAAIAAHGIDDQQRRAAEHLLRDRDPVEVVAALLKQAGHGPRQPFELTPPEPAGERVARAPLPQRGQAGAPPAWRRDADGGGKGAPTAQQGYTRFRLNWGMRQGADARRILAHVCRRGGIPSNQVGAIEIRAFDSTIDVADQVAGVFSRKVRTRDKRDPHLMIRRDTGDPRGRGAAEREQEHE